MDFAASAAKKRSAPLGKQRSIFPGNTLGQMQPVPCARPLPEAPAPPGSGCTGRFYWGEKIFRPCGEQFAPKGCGYVPPGHTQPGQRKCPSAGQPTCGEQFVPKGCGCAPPGLRRRPAAQNKKSTLSGAFLLGAAIESKSEPFISSREMVLVPSLSLKVRIILSSYT